MKFYDFTTLGAISKFLDISAQEMFMKMQVSSIFKGKKSEEPK